LMHNPGGFCQGLVFDHHNAYCIHWGGCLHARHVLEGICPACGEPFRTRGTHWAVCLNVLPGPMLWRARVISPPCPHHDAGMACEFCDQPDNRIFVVERLIVPPTLGHGSGRHVDRIRGMIGRVSCPFDTDGDGHCGRVGCPNCGGPPHG
jgi:hypothetical protein